MSVRDRVEAGPRRALRWAGLALAPLCIALELAGAAPVVLFPLSAAALVPLAALIGEATEEVASRLGASRAALLNATLGNAPELVVALAALGAGRAGVVRGSLVGSIVANVLLVFGLALAVGGRGSIERRPAALALGLVGLAVAVFALQPLAAADPGGSAAGLSVATAAGVLLVAYVLLTRLDLGRTAALAPWPPARGRPLRRSLTRLALAAALTVGAADVLVGSIEPFARQAGMSDLFVTAVVVGIAGNAGEHGAAVVLAARGQVGLGARVALSSAAQVAALVLPIVAIGSLALGAPAALRFRPVELGALAVAAFTALAMTLARPGRWRGAALIAAYAGLAAVFFAGGRA